MIRFEGIHKSFGDHVVLDGVDLRIAAGTVHFIMGRSGAGKSVLIKQVVGLLRPDRGKILFDGHDVTGFSEVGFGSVRRRCQLVFQHSTLFPALTVEENLAMPVRRRFGVGRREALERAQAALVRVHGEDLGPRYPSQLGAGVQKRVAIARAIALEPEAILYDEPTTGLDPVAARRTDRLIRELADTTGVTSVVVSHDVDSARGISDRISFIHEGIVAFNGSMDDVSHDQDSAVCDFIHGHGGTRWALA